MLPSPRGALKMRCIRGHRRGCANDEFDFQVDETLTVAAAFYGNMGNYKSYGFAQPDLRDAPRLSHDARHVAFHANFTRRVAACVCMHLWMRGSMTGLGSK